MNPSLPGAHFVPDSEARVMPDGRLYVYGSYDVSGRMSYCSDVLHVFSTSDLINWVDHGIAFSVKDIPWADAGSILYAPDCIHRNGKYYLYFCLSDNTEGVAVSDFPYGPFQNAALIGVASGDGIDPAIFIDDDKTPYYYWGQFSLRAAKMNPDMKTLSETTVTRNLLDEKRHGFHEGASVRKYKDTYILLYTCILRGRATCLAHATSKHPLGPFTYRGIVIDNIGTDPETWNNHGSIEVFRGKWYVFYHRSSQNSRFNRRLCIEQIDIADDGFIREVLPTTQGAGEAIASSTLIPASSACRIGGWGTNAYIAPDPALQFEEVITNAADSGWAVFRYVRFGGNESSVCIAYSASAPGRFIVSADDEQLCEFSFDPTDGQYRSVSCAITKITGVRTLYIEWKVEKKTMNLRSICFENN